jgi:hypothetical protein
MTRRACYGTARQLCHSPSLRDKMRNLKRASRPKCEAQLVTMATLWVPPWSGPKKCGVPTSKGTSRLGTAATAIRSPSPITTAASCSGAKPSPPHVCRRPSLSSHVYSKNRLAAAHPHQPRCAVRHQHPRPAVPIVHVVVRLGILPEFIAPGTPQQNGRHGAHASHSESRNHPTA